MTIQYETLATGERRLADHRIFEDRRNPNHYGNTGRIQSILLSETRQAENSFGGSEFVFALPVGEDEIEPTRVTTGTFGHVPTPETIGTVTREAINFANIIDGKIRAVWTPTGPEDYPPPPEGYTLVENP